MLKYKELYPLNKGTRGLNDPSLQFNHVTIFSDSKQPKGLFIPLEGSGKLDEAIENGAIASLWKEGLALPSYTPNDFPIIYVEDTAYAYSSIAAQYIQKVKQKECDIMTKFEFYAPQLLNKSPFTYDIAVEEMGHDLLAALNLFAEGKRRGIK
ncbi:hypothetical protein [Heyndrickxia acidicola]|uniref:Uncharacterized protein n=1 Tax=Heyndrickxia acidicola TaxID=209389 RepID=A0ABU6MBW6_9BACI|nr:hypothetical protein [Heyndrickxia acidicola]MED1202167.1 hypothetical protein [Heyndrickxia acidicola]